MRKIISICSSLLLFACSGGGEISLPKSDLALNTTLIEMVGSNEVTVYNTGKNPIKINSISIDSKITTQATTDKDSIDDVASTCKGGLSLNANSSCKLVLVINKGETGVDIIKLDTDIGIKTYEIKINTPLGGLELLPAYISSVGNNLFTITNNLNNNITLNSVVLANSETVDTSSDIMNCFNKVLAPSETCQFHIKGFMGESGSNTISVIANNKPYTFNVPVNTPDNDLQLDTRVIVESGINNINLVNKGNGSIKVNYLAFTAKDSYDTADVTNCMGKTLTQNQQCSISITGLDKVAGLDSIVTITDVGNYNNEVKIDRTGAGILDTDDSANIKTTKETLVKVYNKGSLPLTLKSLDVQTDTPKIMSNMRRMLSSFKVGATDDIAVNDSTCLNKALNSGEVCEIKAKSKGNISVYNTVSFLSANQYMKSQPVKLKQNTTNNSLAFYMPESPVAINETTLDTPTTKTIYIKNDGTNDMNIKSLSLSNTTVGTMVGDSCTGKDIYATESCSVTLQVAKDAHSKVFLQVDTEQQQPNNKLLLSVNNKNLTFSDGATVGTMPTNIHKTFTVTNPNGFNVNISNVINDSTSYTITENTCMGNTIPAKGSCTMVANSNGNSGTSKLTLVSDNFTTPQELTMKVNNGINITSAVTGGAFISAFIVVNDNPENGIMTITNNAGGSFVPNGQNPEWFAGSTNCMQYNNSIPSGTKCKYMLSLPSNDPSSNFGNVTFDFKYDSGDNVLQTFAPFVTRRTVNVPATYQPNQVINATQYIANNACNIPNSMATSVINGSGTYYTCGMTREQEHCEQHSFNSSSGYLLHVANDGVTVVARAFIANGGCVTTQDFTIQNIGGASRTLINNGTYGLFTNDLNCTNNSCSLPLTMNISNWLDTGNYQPRTNTPRTATLGNMQIFTQPVTAQNYTVIDNITWNAQ